MKHKYTKILFLSALFSFTSCGAPADNDVDTFDKSAGSSDIDNAKDLEYRPDGDYDTLSNAGEIAKDRRNHRKINVEASNSPEGSGSEMSSDSSSPGN